MIGPEYSGVQTNDENRKRYHWRYYLACDGPNMEIITSLIWKMGLVIIPQDWQTVRFVSTNCRSQFTYFTPLKKGHLDNQVTLVLSQKWPCMRIRGPLLRSWNCSAENTLNLHNVASSAGDIYVQENMCTERCMTWGTAAVDNLIACCGVVSSSDLMTKLIVLTALCCHGNCYHCSSVSLAAWAIIAALCKSFHS